MPSIDPAPRIKINYRFSDITELLQEHIKQLVNKNISQKLDRYLEKILSKEDAEVIIDIDIKKNKQNRYEGSFRFDLDGQIFVYKNDVPFKNIDDLVNHAFKHLKEYLSKDKDKHAKDTLKAAA
jgi:DNA-binding transcriptional regulator YbjK